MLTSEQLQRDFHYLYPAELPILKWLVSSLPSNPLVINIGSGAGTSGLAILETRADVTLITIDVQDESSPFGCLEAERDVVERAGLHWKSGIYWFQVHADSKEIGREWGHFGGVEFNRNDVLTSAVRWGKRPHMVFVDGDHSYEGCRGDIEAWFPHLADNGILIVHDYLKENIAPNPDGPHPKHWPGVDSAVNELLIPNFPIIVHVDSLIAFRKVVE